MDLTLTLLAGRAARIQDLGRRLAHRGVATSGAGDQGSAALANALVGNAAGDPVLEFVLAGGAIRASRDALVAVIGARAAIGGVPAEPAVPTLLPAGADLTIGAPHGVLAYLAVAGAWHVPRFGGSAAPDVALGFVTGLAAGEALRITEAPDRLLTPALGVGLLRPRLPPPGRSGPLVLLPGPDLAGVPGLSAALTAEPFTVHPHSDAVGLRLTGPLPARPPAAEPVSRGVPVGAVELPGGSQLIVVQRARSLTAGYPIVAVVATIDQGRVAQLRPGEQTGFRFGGSDAERAALRLRDGRIEAVRRAVATALAALADG